MSAERLARFEEALVHLRRTVEGGGVIVEGRKDVEALVALDVGGEHRILNQGKSIDARIDELALEAEVSRWTTIVVLMDWDRTGRSLTTKLIDGLGTRVKVDADCRRRLSNVAFCKCLEDIPAEISSLRRQTV